MIHDSFNDSSVSLSMNLGPQDLRKLYAPPLRKNEIPTNNPFYSKDFGRNKSTDVT